MKTAPMTRKLSSRSSFQFSKTFCISLSIAVLCVGMFEMVSSERSTDAEMKPEYYDSKNLSRTKRGFGASIGGYGGAGGGGYGYGGGVGGAAAIAQQAANQAKAAQAAQGAAAHQAAQQARATLAAQAAQAAHQAQAVTAAKQAQAAQITQAANAAQAAAFSESTQAAKASAAVHAAEAAKRIALHNAQHGGYGTQQQLYAAQHALQEAKNVQAWQAQMAYQAQQNAWALSQKQQASLHDLALAQSAANKAAWAASAAQANIGGYGGHK